MFAKPFNLDETWEILEILEIFQQSFSHKNIVKQAGAEFRGIYFTTRHLISPWFIFMTKSFPDGGTKS